MVATRCHCRVPDCPPGSVNGTCFLKPEGRCFAFIEQVLNEGQSRTELDRRYGCFGPDQHSILQCHGHLVQHQVPKTVACCDDRDYCNIDITPQFIHPVDDYIEGDSLDNIYICLIISIIIIIIVVLCLLIKNCREHIYQKKAKELQSKQDYLSKVNYPIGSNSFKPLLPNYESPSFGYPISTQSSFGLVGSSTTNDSIDSGPSIKYAYFNNSSSNGSSGSQNGSNYTISSYGRHFSSMTSNTTSSLASENTQQTMLSSQKTFWDNSLPTLNENTVSSGSGAGVPRLIQKTLAREISIDKCIGKGRFGKVYLGDYQDEKVAVKIYFSRDEASWKRECEIYGNVIMRGENILRFLGADIISQNACTQLWLVTDYHELGSLYDYLNRCPITNIYQMLSLMKSIIFGLSHIHIEVIGAQGKPAIAHRDIKSKNILMKSTHSCCIADFGLAVTKTQANGHVIIPQNDRVGTKRYMAPEVLSETMKTNSFEDYCQADIYSLGLVFWEIVNRFEVNGVVNEYQEPYSEYLECNVSGEPTLEEMKHIVYDCKLRPQFTNIPRDDKVFEFVLNLINECWADKPFARLTSMRIKKSIKQLIDGY